jgi:putative transposase
VTLTNNDLSELLVALNEAEITDRVRASLRWILQELIEAESTAQSGAGPRAGDLQLRTGSFYPSLLERRRRIDQALHAVVMEAWVHGVSTRKVDDLVKALGIGTGISKSEVSRICSELDQDLTNEERTESSDLWARLGFRFRRRGTQAS